MLKKTNIKTTTEKAKRFEKRRLKEQKNIL